jgi:hypothetical protein
VDIKRVEEPALGVGCSKDCGVETEFSGGGTIVDEAAADGRTTPGIASRVVVAASLVATTVSLNVWLVAIAEEFVESVRMYVEEKVLPLESISIS